MKVFVTKAKAPYLIALTDVPGKLALYFNREVRRYNSDTGTADIIDDVDVSDAIRRWESLPQRNR